MTEENATTIGTELSQMPTEIAELYDVLYNDVCNLKFEWNLFCQLFNDKIAVELLNRSAASFFAVVQNVFWSNTMLGIARLLDNKTVAGKDTLGFDRFISQIDSLGFHELKPQLDDLLANARVIAKPSTKRRHNLIAHSNYDIRLKRIEITDAVTFNNTNDTLSAIFRFMNCVEMFFLGSWIMYEELSTYDDANTLLRCLRKAEASNLSQREVSEFYRNKT